MLNMIAYHLAGFVIFCLLPALVAAVIGTIIHPKVGLIFFIAVLGFTMTLCFGKSKSDEQP